MKKFLLSLAISMTAACGAFAQTVIKADQFNPGGSATVGGYTVELQKNSGTTAPAYHANTGAIRLYAKGSLTVSGEKISKIVVTLASDAAYRYTTFTPSTGAFDPAQAAGDTEITWVGNASSVTFTVGDFATMGTDGESKAGQIRFTSITVYGKGGNGGGNVDPTPGDTEGNGTEENPYTVNDVIALNNTISSAAWVTGYIVGAMNTGGSEYVFETTAPFTAAANIYIAATPGETDQTKMVPVQLVGGSTVRADLNLVDRPENFGKEVSVKGNLEKYFGQPGIKNTSDYTIVGGIAPLPVEEIASLTAFVEEQSDANLKITGAVTVFYQSPDKKYTFITDGETNLEVYGNLPEYKNGDQLTGIIGKFSFYQNMPQMTPQTDSFGEATQGTPVEPKKVAANQIGIAQYVTVENVEITEEDGKFYIGEGAEQRQVFDRFALDQIKAGIATITGIGAIYGETLQIFPTAIDFSSSISEISAENGAAEIFDLPGRKVANPGRGFYIVGGQKKFIR